MPSTLADNLTAIIALLAVAALFAFVVWRIRRQNGWSLEGLRELEWQNFQKLVAESMRRQGYRVIEQPPNPEADINLVLAREGQRYLMQCKYWRAQFVGLEPLQSLSALVKAEGAAGAIALTTGHFTTDAKKYAEQAGIELIEGDGLHRLLSGAGQTAPR